MSRKRTLRPEEERLWQAVARTATALPKRRPLSPDHSQAASPIADMPLRLAPEPVAQPLPAFRIGERATGRVHEPAPLPSGGVPSTLQMDARSFERMARGKLAPEARLDLHGMTLSEAQPELVRFVLNAQGQGLRLVLVITGKGRVRPDHGPIPHRQGILRQQVPRWLRMPPLSGAVLQVAEAHQRHGGSGAAYVYLRRGGR